MYEVGIQKSFISQHYLTGGDWGDENQLHSHHFRLEVTGTGETLDRHFYLFDISRLKNICDALVAHYADRTLNDLAEFKGKNPSLELFCFLLFKKITEDFRPEHMGRLKITLWEDEEAWASYEDQLSRA